MVKDCQNLNQNVNTNGERSCFALSTIRPSVSVLLRRDFGDTKREKETNTYKEIGPTSDSSETIMWYGSGLNVSCVTGSHRARLQQHLSSANCPNSIGPHINWWSRKCPDILGRASLSHDMGYQESSRILESSNHFHTTHALLDATVPQRSSTNFIPNFSPTKRKRGSQQLCSQFSSNSTENPNTSDDQFKDSHLHVKSSATFSSGRARSSADSQQPKQMDIFDVAKIQSLHFSGNSKLAPGNSKSTEHLVCSELDYLNEVSLCILCPLIIKFILYLKPQVEFKILTVCFFTYYDSASISFLKMNKMVIQYLKNSSTIEVAVSYINKCKTHLSNIELKQRESGCYQLYSSHLLNHINNSSHIRNHEFISHNLKPSITYDCDFTSHNDVALVRTYFIHSSKNSKKRNKELTRNYLRYGHTMTKVVSDHVHICLGNHLARQGMSANTNSECSSLQLERTTPYHDDDKAQTLLPLLECSSTYHLHVLTPFISTSEINTDSTFDGAPPLFIMTIPKQINQEGISCNPHSPLQTSQPAIGQPSVHSSCGVHSLPPRIVLDQGTLQATGHNHKILRSINQQIISPHLTKSISHTNLTQRVRHYTPVILVQLCTLWLFSLCILNALKGPLFGRTLRKSKSLTRNCFPLVLLYATTLLFGLSPVTAQGLVGTISLCSNEGESVTVPGITDDPCISCFCKNGQVKCEKAQCPKLEGCHAILYGQQSRSCCRLCKGCKYKGKQYESGQSWLDPKDSCTQLSCRAGVVTISKVQCFVPCYASLAPVYGQCCPRCEGCYYGGKTYTEGDTFKLPTDSCTTCACQKSHLVCERQQCPVLNCPPEVIYQPDNECCPMCRGTREVFDVRSKCYFAKMLYKRHQRFSPAKCTECVCKSSTSVCSTTTCPPLNCPAEERVPLEGSPCCQVCVEKRPCQFAGETYKNREYWRPNICMACVCEDGRTYCTRQKCNNSLWCPPGYKLQLSRHECCPRCIEHDAVCSVFGDPHYRTFDGLTYSFQGTCKYVLAQTCTGKKLTTTSSKTNKRKKTRASPKPIFYRAKGKKRKKKKKKRKKKKEKDEDYFMIKVRNDVRFSSGFAWTQMLVVLLAKHRISMLQGGVIKIDRQKVRRMPHTEPGQFTVSRSGGLVKLRTTFGLQVAWDGDSFVEVTVTTRLKFKVCGLCGSYNGIKADDLQGPDGKMYATGQEMGHAWRVGGTRACQSRPLTSASEPLCEHDVTARLRAHRVCSVFYGRAFSKCRSVVDVEVYASSCITDMCDCPSGRYCACEAIRAYTSQCSRAGAQVKWDSLTDFCNISPECSADSRLVDCAETCPGTCERPGSDVPCPTQCMEACWCKDRSKVFHAGKCITSSQCPATTGR